MEETRLQDPTLRQSQRVLAMVHELHKQGYQQLAVYSGISASGVYWRCKIVPASYLFYTVDGDLELRDAQDVKTANYSSASSNQYFGWEDAVHDTARKLSAKFIERFPDLCREGRGENFEYSGWLTYAVGKSEEGHLPVMYSDYWESIVGEIRSTGNETLIAPPHKYMTTEGEFS